MPGSRRLFEAVETLLEIGGLLVRELPDATRAGGVRLALRLERNYRPRLVLHHDLVGRVERIGGSVVPVNPERPLQRDTGPLQEITES